MSTDQLPHPVFVDTPSALQSMLAAFQGEPIVAIDTESNSLYAYYERVCLIQFSIPSQDFLVDPIVLPDLSALTPLFQDPQTEKIFHAAEYDLIMLKQDFGFSFNNIFDTMVAARILGWKAVGLGSVLKDQFNVQLTKKYQKANWGARPLSQDMLLYAQQDTHYLIRLRARLKAQLMESGRWPLAEEDFLRACTVQVPQKKDTAPDCFRINGARDLSPQQLAVLQEICAYRDQIARANDRPLFKVINNHVLFKIAETCPRTLDELGAISGFSHRQVRWLGKGLISAVRRGMKAKPPKFPRRPRRSEAYMVRVDLLRQWRKNTARQLGVESDIVLPKSLLYQFAEAAPDTRDQVSSLMAAVPYRQRQYGEEIFDLLNPPARRQKV